MRKTQVTFADNPQMKIIGLQQQKHGYQNHTCSDKASKDTVVYRTWHSKDGESSLI